MTERHCLLCKYCTVDAGHPGWSDETPGDGVTITCRKGHWDITNPEYDVRIQLSVAMRNAETCPDYTWEA